MHSTWAVPKWREGDILHSIQVTTEAGLVEREGVGGRGGRKVGTVWSRETHTKGRGGGEDQTICSFTDGCLFS